MNCKRISRTLYTLVAILFATSVYAQEVTYTHDGITVKFKEVVVEAGIDKPFSVVHLSDSHLTYADERDTQRKIALAARRNKRNLTPKPIVEAQRQYAIENNLPIVHSGDMIDFVSEANLDAVKDIFSKGDWIVCAGNHEFSLYVGEAKEDDAYREQSYDKVQAAFPNDLNFHSRVINGVNFVTIFNGYYKFTKEQLDLMKREVKRGLPIIMVCHNPLYTPEMCEYALKRSKGRSAGLVGVPEEITSTFAQKPRPKGEEWRNRSVQQHADKATLRFCKWLKKQEELKAILCGHCHYNFTTQFSPTAIQHAVGAGYHRYGYVVNIN